MTVLAFATFALFYGYVFLLIAAGAWGVFGARIDHRLLFGLDLTTLDSRAAASLVSQYRFLRAIELGFGAWSLVFRREIFADVTFNRIFLGAMTLGVLARLISIARDGLPRPVFHFFLISEGVGAVLIYVYSRGTLEG